MANLRGDTICAEHGFAAQLIFAYGSVNWWQATVNSHAVCHSASTIQVAFSEFSLALLVQLRKNKIIIFLLSLPLKGKTFVLKTIFFLNLSLITQKTV